MKARSIGFWVTTGLFTLAMAASAAADLLRPPTIVEGLARLAYPAYLPLLLGAWKVLGVAALLAPRLPRLKEWAYAGFVFELTGAVFSHVAAGDGANAGPALVLTLLAVGSWALRPDARRIAASPAASAPAPAGALAPAE